MFELGMHLTQVAATGRWSQKNYPRTLQEFEARFSTEEGLEKNWAHCYARSLTAGGSLRSSKPNPLRLRERSGFRDRASHSAFAISPVTFRARVHGRTRAVAE